MHDDRDMILNEYKWPCWPFLPVKRKNSKLEDKNLGFILSSVGKITIWHEYMFDLKDGWQKSCQKTEYNSVDEMLQDGWMVD